MVFYRFWDGDALREVFCCDGADESRRALSQTSIAYSSTLFFVKVSRFLKIAESVCNRPLTVWDYVSRRNWSWQALRVFLDQHCANVSGSTGCEARPTSSATLAWKKLIREKFHMWRTTYYLGQLVLLHGAAVL